MQLEPIREEYIHTVDQGELYITTKRVVFHGSKKNSTIRLNKILAVQPYTDAIVVEKESGKNPIFLLHDPELPAVVLGAMLNNV